MIVAELLGVPMDDVRLVQSDTALVPRGTGTMGSRSLQTAGSAVHNASEEVLEKAKQLAAHLLEANPDDIVLHDGGKLGVAGVPASALSWGELASAAADPARRPADWGRSRARSRRARLQPGRRHLPVRRAHRRRRGRRRDGRGRVASGTSRSTTAAGSSTRCSCAGQQHGGIAQGVAQALCTRASCTTTTATRSPRNLMDYAMPSAAEFPSFEASNTETPTPLNPLGAKGIGESGTIGSTPAVQNAVIDALSHLGIRHIDMPLTAERVWRAIQDAPSP